ncbi:cupredoxin domain-containing protein [Arthrobacter sp. NPDC080073]|uniref:cupredoxin domain-containing protein n=1 Tax=Arthrobacter sp. NPDC080073 TaxID=3155919 RepID=UPI00343EED7C
MKKSPKTLMVIAAAAALVAVSGCGSSGTGGYGASSSPPSAASSGAPQSPSLTITIKDFGYQGPVSVSPGAKITVKNEDTQAHTVTSDDGKAFDAAVDGGGGTTQFTAPTAPGSYPYHCTYHSNMHGTLVVK